MPQKFLVNPRRKTRRHKRRRKLYGAAAEAHARKLARGKRRHTRKYSHNPKKGAKVARKRRKVVRHRRRIRRVPALRTRVRRRVRRYGRKLSRSLLPMVQQGAKDGAGVAVGFAAVKVIPNLVGMGGKTGAMKYGVDALAAVAAGYAAHRFLGANVGRNVLAGGFGAVYLDIVKGLNIPVLSAALGDYSFASYPQGVGIPGAAGMLQWYGTYPEDEDVAGVQYVQ
jgi:hypothetical protein